MRHRKYGSASRVAGLDSGRHPHLILRTSWVYGMRGKNFLLTVLRLAQDRGELRIVADQFGAPTWSRTIAEATARIVARGNWDPGSGIYHLTATGRTSWHGFAEAILANAALAKPPVVTPIASADYPHAGTPSGQLGAIATALHRRVRRAADVGRGAQVLPGLSSRAPSFPRTREPMLSVRSLSTSSSTPR